MTNMEAAEILFAQKLASCEPTLRKRAIYRLQQWILENSKSQGFAADDLGKLWKGLYYCMWMQDKPLIQEELAENISNLVEYFNTAEEKFLFLSTFVQTLGQEWSKIDRWRMDKFMMLFRRLLRRFLHELHVMTSSTDEPLRDLLSRCFTVLRSTVLSPVNSSACPDGLKYHFLAVYLDELDAFSSEQSLTPADVTFCLQPFMGILRHKRTSDKLFETVMAEIFETILRDFSESLVEDDEGEETSAETTAGIKFDYKEIGKMLFDVGSIKSIVASRRKVLFTYSKRFELAAANKDPFEDELVDYDSDENEVTAEDLDAAALRYLSRLKADNEKVAAMRLQSKSSRLKRGVKSETTAKRPRITDEDNEELAGSNEGDEEQDSPESQPQASLSKKKRQKNKKMKGTRKNSVKKRIGRKAK